VYRVFEEIDGSGHWLPMEAAEEVTAKIIAFLDDVSTTTDDDDDDA
jgi:pimeloyl-ACP methyl ester carboxylesterase